MVEIINHQNLLEFEHELLASTVEHVLSTEGIQRARVNIAIVDNSTIHQLNLRYLGHDYATDVLSFLLKREADSLHGEIMISAEMAVETAVDFNWSPAAELLLYAVHGTLHLVGFDDRTDEDRHMMRDRERYYFNELGLDPRYDEQTSV